MHTAHDIMLHRQYSTDMVAWRFSGALSNWRLRIPIQRSKWNTSSQNLLNLEIGPMQSIGLSYVYYFKTGLKEPPNLYI